VSLDLVTELRKFAIRENSQDEILSRRVYCICYIVITESAQLTEALICWLQNKPTKIKFSIKIFRVNIAIMGAFNI
jgi:hypothetical protein